jgi:PPM family protein phosphatase
MSIEADEDTLEIPAPTQTPTDAPPEPLSALVKVDVAAQTHTGKVRESNEDNYLVARGSRSLEMLLSSVQAQVPPRTDEIGYAMIVADGMGGAAAGEIASSTAMVSLVNLVLNTPDWILQTEEPMPEEIMARMQQRFLQVDAAVSDRARETPELAGMGTTLTAAWSIGHDLFVGHVGDSRAYMHRAGKLYRMTKDQTLAQSMIDGGIMKATDSLASRFSHVLTQAIGTGGRSLHPEIRRWRLDDGDRLLLCTDGLTDMLDDAAIAAILSEHNSAADACRALVDRALDNGGVDNITAIVAGYSFPQSERRQDSGGPATQRPG